MISRLYDSIFSAAKNLSKIFTIIFLLLCGYNLYAQSSEEIMLQGNKFYQAGQFEQAIETYQNILSQGFESAALYYNLGNAYFKAGRLGYAILSYEKGLKLAPGDEDLQYNLKIANARTADKLTGVPKLFIVQWWEVLLTSFSVTGWSIITIFIYLIFLSSIGLYLLSRKINIQKTAFMIGSISLSVLIISAFVLFSRYNHEATTNYGILLNSVYSVKVSPDERSNDAFVIHEGIKFTLEDHVNDWIKIRLVDGKIGWVQKNAIGQI